ncbi:DUF72 domain-containing protein [Planctomycetota bacterium]|nr:DUF72 domain-containing protein [Planctomycetota bacterium]MDC3251666.1 DUF72 domain-containing protein [Planctomycetota bacterium]
MNQGPPKIRLGTSSWSEKSWRGVFYPDNLQPADFIQHYSRVYDTVEIDSTFYAIPRVSTVNGWRRKTPDQFTFSAKVPRIVTHDKVLIEAEEEMEIFVETMQWLGDKLGLLLLQFPYFNKKAFSDKREFLDRLANFLPRFSGEVKLVVELRNKNWIQPEVSRLIESMGASLAWVDQAWMPDPEEWLERLGSPSGQIGYFRFLGDHKALDAMTDTWDRQVLDPREKLKRWIAPMNKFLQAGGDVYGYFNNHYAGHAPATLEDFRDLWGQDHSSSSSSV